MSSRSLNGQDLNLHNLSVSGNVELADVTMETLTVTNDLEVLNDTSLNELDVNGLSTCQSVNVLQNLAVTGTTQMTADVTADNNMIIAGNLTVQGTLTANTNSNMEIVYFHVTGNAGSVSQTMELYQNTTGTTNYSVFPSFYYGYGGSGGTYDIGGSCGSVSEIMITERQSGTFGWYMNKTTGDNINIYVVFLVIYNVSSSDYPSSY